MPSIGHDLAAIRTHKGYSLEDIQKATRIPLDTLESIEDGSIFTDSNEITTYIRSFVRSYGRALKLNDSLLTEALDQEELGHYNNLLLESFPELSDDFDTTSEDTEVDSETDESPGEKDPDKPAGKLKKKKGVSAARPVSSNAGSADVRNIDWSKLGKKINTRRSQPPVWLIVAGFIIILIIVASILISQFDLFSSEDIPSTDPLASEESVLGNAEQGLSLELTEDEPQQEAPPPELQDTLFLTIYAAYGRLDPVRVWSDMKPRIDPFWIERGTALNFEFQDSVFVRGNYSNMLLFLNGNRIDNIQNRYLNVQENFVELTREQFSTNPRWATPVPMEVPGDVAEPDTVLPRPSF